MHPAQGVASRFPRGLSRGTSEHGRAIEGERDRRSGFGFRDLENYRIRAPFYAGSRTGGCSARSPASSAHGRRTPLQRTRREFSGLTSVSGDKPRRALTVLDWRGRGMPAFCWASGRWRVVQPAERLTLDQEVGGSSPPPPATYGAHRILTALIASLVARWPSRSWYRRCVTSCPVTLPSAPGLWDCLRACRLGLPAIIDRTTNGRARSFVASILSGGRPVRSALLDLAIGGVVVYFATHVAELVGGPRTFRTVASSTPLAQSEIV